MDVCRNCGEPYWTDCGCDWCNNKSVNNKSVIEVLPPMQEKKLLHDPYYKPILKEGGSQKWLGVGAVKNLCRSGEKL